MNTLRWLRVPGDTIFAIGVLAMGWFMLGIVTGWSYRKERGPEPGELIEAREPVGAI